ncbi:hypothetical protein ANCCEY_04143 [Ancylostoma ceylanicum]|uniref:Major facilitator superfamily (MFS) profile domain-containing protein n=1 Tax=Ancylostoma ceylanicum TaxID=53326 RepID=A0A0D6M3A5_9BILA|nr:hypothetical protein ANCCEY_04143 [Ancylostoma ceylanicum]
MDDLADVVPIRNEGNDEVPLQRRVRPDHDIVWWKKFGYGVGHFYNDLCASMWFTYLMIYLEKVLRFRSSRAGLLMLIGQFGWASVQISHLALIPELSSIDSSRTTMNSLSRMNSFSSDASELMRMHWTSWFGHIQFYQIALLYMLSRLYINISQVYFPFYITLTQNFGKKYVAIFPMVSYLSSFVVSTITGIPCLNRFLNRKMYSVACLIGVSQAILLITSLSITADLINKNTESGAFVYGAMSFVDKLANGLAYQIIELWNPSCDPTQPHKACTIFYRTIMVFVPGGCLVIALLILLSLLPSQIGHRVRGRRSDDQVAIMEDEDLVADETQ